MKQTAQVLKQLSCNKKHTQMWIQQMWLLLIKIDNVWKNTAKSHFKIVIMSDNCCGMSWHLHWSWWRQT